MIWICVFLQAGWGEVRAATCKPEQVARASKLLLTGYLLLRLGSMLKLGAGAADQGLKAIANWSPAVVVECIVKANSDRPTTKPKKEND